MKRITLKSRVLFTLRGKVRKTFTFEKGVSYEVDDAIADNAFIKERLLSVEEVKKPRKTRAAAPKKAAVEETQKDLGDVEPADN